MEPPKSMVEALYQAQGGVCFYCRCSLQPGPFRYKKRPQGWTRDHVVPRAKGGRDGGNIVLACVPCNTGKSDRDPTDDELAALRVVTTLARALLGL